VASAVLAGTAAALLPTNPAGAATYSPRVLTTTSACRYSLDGYWRAHDITMSGNLSAADVTPGEAVTFSGVTVATEIPGPLLTSAYQLGLLGLGVNQIPVQAWVALAGSNTVEGVQVVGPVDVIAETTISVSNGQATATPLSLTNAVLPDTTWTRQDTGSSSVNVTMAPAGNLPAITVGGANVTPQGSVFVSAALGEGRLNLDCQAGLPNSDGEFPPVNECLSSLGRYVGREIEPFNIELDGRATRSGTQVALRDTELELLVPSDLLLALYRQNATYEGSNGYLWPGENTLPLKAWVAIEAANTVEGVQVVEAEATWSATITDPTPGPAHPNPDDPAMTPQDAGAARTVARNLGDESATTTSVTVQLPDTTWTAAGDAEVTFRQAAPGTLPLATVVGRPSGSEYTVAPFGSIFIRAETQRYGMNLDCSPGTITVVDPGVSPHLCGAAPSPGCGNGAQSAAGRYGIAAVAAPVFAAATDSGGYRLVARDGGIFAFGDASFDGSGAESGKTFVGAAPTATGDGYWLAASDGTVLAFGDAEELGSVTNPNQPIVGIAATPTGEGYWLVARDGGIFAFGDAEFHGSTGDIPLNEPILGMASTASGEGYWLVASDGGIFSFGDAVFHGSTGDIPLNEPIVGMASTASGEGYWLVASDGGIFSFGDALFSGSTGDRVLNQPIIGFVPAL